MSINDLPKWMRFGLVCLVCIGFAYLVVIVIQRF